MIVLIMALVGLVVTILGVSVFVKNKYLVVATNYWDKKKDKKGNPYSPLRRKFTGVGYIFFGLIIVIMGFGIYADEQRKQEKEEHIKNESQRLNMSIDEYRTIDSAFLFMPKNSTVEDYKKIDEKAKKQGFKDGYDYLITEYSAKKEGKNIEDVIAERKVKAEKEAAERRAKEEQEASENAAEAKRAQEQEVNSNSKYTRNKYTDSDASNVAYCFAFLEVAKKPYLEKTHRLYVQDNEAVFFEEVQPALNKLVQCSGPNAPDQAAIEACIAQLPKEAPLIDGFMRGSNVALHGDATEKTVSSAACMGLDVAIR